MTTIFRVQDVEGRGPFRPGFSREWIEVQKTLPAVHIAFDMDAIMQAHADGLHIGTGCRTIDQLKTKWFTKKERHRLDRLGYRLVMMDADRIIGENQDQLVFARALHLSRGATIVSWKGSFRGEA